MSFLFSSIGSVLTQQLIGIGREACLGALSDCNETLLNCKNLLKNQFRPFVVIFGTTQRAAENLNTNVFKTAHYVENDIVNLVGNLITNDDNSTNNKLEDSDTQKQSLDSTNLSTELTNADTSDKGILSKLKASTSAVVTGIMNIFTQDGEDKTSKISKHQKTDEDLSLEKCIKEDSENMDKTLSSSFSDAAETSTKSSVTQSNIPNDANILGKHFHQVISDRSSGSNISTAVFTTLVEGNELNGKVETFSNATTTCLEEKHKNAITAATPTYATTEILKNSCNKISVDHTSTIESGFQDPLAKTGSSEQPTENVDCKTSKHSFLETLQESLTPTVIINDKPFSSIGNNATNPSKPVKNVDEKNENLTKVKESLNTDHNSSSFSSNALSDVSDLASNLVAQGTGLFFDN